MSPCSRPLVALLVALLALGLLPGVLLAAPAPAASAPDASVPGQLLIAFEPGTARAEQDAAVARRGGRVVQEFPNLGALLIELPANATAMAALGLAAEPAVRYAQPNYTYTLGQLPDDTRLGDLWGLHNTGQAGGTADADIDAPAAWDLTTGGAEVVVGVVDSGILYTHPDLADNIWSAPAGWNLNGCGPGTHGYRRAPGDPSRSA